MQKRSSRKLVQIGTASDESTYSDLAAYYFANKEFNKQSTKEHYDQIINGILVPRWGKRVAVEIRPVEVKHWLKTLQVEDPTRAKYRSVMGRFTCSLSRKASFPLAWRIIRCTRQGLFSRFRLRINNA
jgi:hypothetical protein